MINVFLAEDHALVTEGIQSMLADASSIRCTGCFANGESLLQKLRQVQPDIILMDINLPDMSGIELCRKVVNEWPGIGVIALSINNQPAIIRKMMDQGAGGYVLKDAGKAEILEAIQTVAKGQTYLSRSAGTSLRSEAVQALPALTRREREILERIADGQTNPQIAAALFVDVSTVSSHRKNMLAKYHVQNTAALIKLAITEKLI